MHNCAVWNFPVEAQSLGHAVRFTSPRAGGRYVLSGSVESQVRERCGTDKEMQLAITEYVLESNLNGVEPRINSDNVERVFQTRLPKFEYRAFRLLRHIMAEVRSLGDVWSFHKENNFCLALCGAWIHHEVDYFLDYFAERKFVSLSRTMGGPTKIVVRPEAHIFVDEQLGGAPTGDQVFVAMWFGEEMQSVYKEAIEPAIRETGYTPKLVSDEKHNRNINTEIVGQIRRSKIVVADFTCPPKEPRGGVYFEAGFAFGLGIPVIWTCRSTSKGDLHFDTRPYNHLLWESSTELKRDLKSSIRANVGEGPHIDQIVVD